MAKKVDFKQLMIDKGEKIGLGVGAGIMALLIVLGIMSAAGAQSANKTAKGLTDKASAVIRTLNTSDTGSPPPIDPELINKVPTFDPYSALAYATKNDVFDRTAASTAKRTNPRILGVAEMQVALVRSNIEVIDLIDVQGEPRVGIVTTKQLPENEVKRLTKIKKKVKSRSQLQQAIQRQRQGMMGRGGMGGGMMGPGGPGGGMMGPGGMGGGRGGPPPGMRMGPGGGGSGGPGMGMGGIMGGPGSFNPNQKRSNVLEQVTYVPLDSDQLKNNDHTLALTLFPLRMAVIRAAFPYKEQLKEFQRALHYNSLEEMLADPNFSMHFDGFAVQRRRHLLDGKPVMNQEGGEEGWVDFDWLDASRDILVRRVADYDPSAKNPDLAFVIPPADEMLAIPLPELKGNVEYPPLNLKAITDTLAAIKKALADKQPAAQSELVQRLKERSRRGLFDPVGGMGNTGGGEAAMGGKPTNPGMPRPGGLGTAGGGVGTDTPGGSGARGMPNPGQLYGQSSDMIPDYWLVRFIDPTVEPGYKYEYRIRARMKNPNFVPKDDRKGNWASRVIHPSLAESEDLDPKPWTDKDMVASAPLPVEPESRKYVVSEAMRTDDPTKYAYFSERVDLELQSWKKGVSLGTGDTREEPVGAWVVSPKMPTQRGQFIGSRMKVKLPLWSSSQATFVIREGLRSRGQPGQQPRRAGRGVVVDFSTRSVLLDFEGGHGSYVFPGHVVEEEDYGVSTLILTDDGRLVVRNSGIDLKDKDRIDRKKDWDDWVRKVESEQKERDSGSNDRLRGGPGGKGGGNPP